MSSDHDMTLMSSSTGILPRPLSERSLNQGQLESGLLKRKRDVQQKENGLGEPFIIFESTGEKSLELVPRLLLPRSCLPLAYLDSKAGPDGISYPRFLSGSFPSLEGPEDISPEIQWPRVLIMEDQAGKRLYAVEGVRDKTYTICRLCQWVTVHDFRSAPAKAKTTICNKQVTTDTGDDQWWKKAALGYSGRCPQPRCNDGNTTSHGLRLSLKPPRDEALLPSSEEYGSELGGEKGVSEQIVCQKAATIVTDAAPAPSTDPGDIHDMIRASYLEDLYIKKTSLAYFAKGPLSRARAAVGRDSSSITSCGLREFLRENVLSVPTNDKKYSETLPALIKEIPHGITSEDESSLLSDQMRKFKKRKKTSKGGLAPGEEQYVVRWWLHQERASLTGDPGETREQRVKQALVEQRARETQLQIILILEILALEAVAMTDSSMVLPDNKVLEGNESTMPVQAKKSGKPQNLSNLLDVLVDRLCIWHSTSQGELISTGVTQIAEEEKITRHTSDGDRLRDFCSEVVVPFYATRLPDLYPSICRKLGGPTVPSPARTSLQQPSSKPGASLPRTHSYKARKPLERVLTNKKTTSRRPPTLTRSVTDSVLPGIKKELSDIALSAIPATRPTLQNSKRYSQREVDLTAASQATEAKLQRKAAIEQELQGAIAAMKKPNPRMAVKELVEASERRAAAGLRSKKSRNPARNPLAQGIQVMATPKVNRRTNLYPDLPRLPAPYCQPDEPHSIPPSSDPRIPSSTIKPASLPGLQPPASTASVHLTPSAERHLPFPKRPQLPPSLATTPSHRPSKLSKSHLSDTLSAPHDEDELAHPSPQLPPLTASQLSLKRPLLIGRTPSFDSPVSKSVHDTPSRKRPPRQWAAGVRTEQQAQVKDTPVKAKDRPVTDQHQHLVQRGTAGQEKSIYETLGWDDDVDELM